jgi:hypothetical protein
MKIYFAICSVFIFAAGCVAVGKFQPGESEMASLQQKVPGITMERVKTGFVLYKEKCSGCHRLHAPSEYTIDGWNKNLLEMFPKSKTEDEKTKTAIRDYLHAMSK